MTTWDNEDGATRGMYDIHGLAVDCNNLNIIIPRTIGELGIAQFIQIAGYSVDECYNQALFGYQNTATNVNINSAGFRFNDFKNEINNNRPVILNLKLHNKVGYGHTVLAIGYKEDLEPPYCQTAYFYDTSDYSVHEIDWEYGYINWSDFLQYDISDVTVVQLTTPATQVDRIQLDSGSSSVYDDTMIEYEFSFIDEGPEVNNIETWHAEARFYHSNGALRQGTWEEGYNSNVNTCIQDVDLWSENYQWVRNPYGEVRGDIVVTAIDYNGNKYIFTKEIGVITTPDLSQVLDFMQTDNSLAFSLANDGATSYYIYYGTNANGPYNGTGALEGNSPVLFNAWDDIKLTGLTPNTNWHFAIKGYNGLGENLISQDYEVFVQDTLSVPTDVTIVRSGDNMHITWVGDSLATGFDIYVSDDPYASFDLWANIATVTEPYYDFEAAAIDKQFFIIVAVSGVRNDVIDKTVPIMSPNKTRIKNKK